MPTSTRSGKPIAVSVSDIEAASSCAKALISEVFDSLAETCAGTDAGEDKRLFFPDGIEFIYVNLTIQPSSPSITFGVKIGGPTAAQHVEKSSVADTSVGEADGGSEPGQVAATLSGGQ
jgi:hypothetical protein